MKNKRVRIGEVGVDSGQLMVCDPCYIHGEWKETQALDVGSEQYVDNDNGTVWVCDLHVPNGSDDRMRFNNYGTPLKVYGGLTPNQLIESGRWQRQDRQIPGEGEFSYQGCCAATIKKPNAGQLAYKLGHAGAGVAFASGYGDGCYPVFATYNNEGRIVKVEIIME